MFFVLFCCCCCFFFLSNCFMPHADLRPFFLEVKIEESLLVDKTAKINLKLLRVQKEVMACAERKENFITFKWEPKLNHIRQAIGNTIWNSREHVTAVWYDGLDLSNTFYTAWYNCTCMVSERILFRLLDYWVFFDVAKTNVGLLFVVFVCLFVCFQSFVLCVIWSRLHHSTTPRNYQIITDRT